MFRRLCSASSQPPSRWLAREHRNGRLAYPCRAAAEARQLAGWVACPDGSMPDRHDGESWRAGICGLPLYLKPHACLLQAVAADLPLEGRLRNQKERFEVFRIAKSAVR